MHREEDVPASPRLKVALPGLPYSTTPKDFGPHSSSTALGGNANLPSPSKPHWLAKCVQELREAMKPFTTFHDHESLGKEVAGQETPAAEVEGAAWPGTPPTTQLAAPVTWLSTLALAPAAQQATTQKAKGAMSFVPSNWTEIHPSHPAAPVRCIPLSLGDLRWWCHSWSSSHRRRACHQIEEGQLQGDQGDSSPASSQDSPKQGCNVKGNHNPETSGVWLRMPPPGFVEIAQSLWGSNLPCWVSLAQVVPCSYLTGATSSPTISTRFCQDLSSGMTYLSKVTTSMSMIRLGLPLSL